MGMTKLQQAASNLVRNELIQKMDKLINRAKQEQRSLTDEEKTSFNKMEQEVKEMDADSGNGNEKDSFIESKLKEFEKESRSAKRRSENPLEVRGYRGKERIGEHKTDVQIGDLIYSHITGKFRNEEVRAALSTTSGGLTIPTEVYSNFIDMLRDVSFLGECTVYPMNTKALSIPKVVGDIAPAFKLENELIAETTPIFDSAQLEAKPLYALCPISLELIEASNLDMGSVITQLMASAMGAAMQNFMLHGGVNGYTGILNDAGINTITTATVDYTSIGAGIRAVRNNNGVVNGLVINSDDLMNLELLQDTTNQYIQPPKFMDDLRIYDVANSIVTGSAMLGDLSSIAFGVLSEGGLQIEIDRYGEAFSRGQIRIRARLNGDFTLTNPKLISQIIPTI